MPNSFCTRVPKRYDKTAAPSPVATISKTFPFIDRLSDATDTTIPTIERAIAANTTENARATKEDEVIIK